MSATLSLERERGEERAIRLIRAAVRIAAWRDLKKPDLIGHAASGLDIPRRTARALYNRELTRVREAEYNGLLGRFLCYLDREASDLRARAAELERQRVQLERSGACATGSPLSSHGGTSVQNADRSSSLNEVSAALQDAATSRARFVTARSRVRR
jgi:hypothetical protein